MPHETTPPPDSRREYDGREINFEVRNARPRPLSDLYHNLMRGSWLKMLVFCFGGYVLLIAAFAVLYWIGGDCVENARAGHFADMFWFSVQTFSTIGYGGMAPKTPYAHALVTLESFVGLAGVAMGTALLFSRFSRPSARVIFSQHAIIRDRNGTPTLHLRIANERTNHILGAQVRLSVLVEETTDEGEVMRRMRALRLSRDSTPMFSMSWTLFHPITPESPLHGVTPETIDDRVLLMLLTFAGTDDALMQQIHTRHFFLAEDIVFDQRHADVLTVGEGRLLLDLAHMDDLEPLDGGD